MNNSNINNAKSTNNKMKVRAKEETEKNENM